MEPIPGSLEGTMLAVETEAASNNELIWAKLRKGLLKTTEEVCSTNSSTNGNMKLGGELRKQMMPSQPSVMVL